MSRNWQFAMGNCNMQVKKMPNRVFVGGLPFDTTSTELVEFFSNFGAVLNGKVIYDYCNISRGYGFITFYRAEDVEKVLKLGVIFFKEKRLKIAEAFRRLKKRYPQRTAFPSTRLIQLTPFPTNPPQYAPSRQGVRPPAVNYNEQLPQGYQEQQTYGNNSLWYRYH